MDVENGLNVDSASIYEKRKLISGSFASFVFALGHDCEAKNSDIEAEESDEHLRQFAELRNKRIG